MSKNLHNLRNIIHLSIPNQTELSLKVSSRKKGIISQNLALTLEIIVTGITEIWSYKMRSLLTLTLLTLGVFSLITMTSIMDGLSDKILAALSGSSWDSTVGFYPKDPQTTEESKRFLMSAGLRYEDLSRIAAPHPKILAFIPKAYYTCGVRTSGGIERVVISGVTPDYFPVMNRQIKEGRAITEDDQRRRSKVAVVGPRLASKLMGGADPLGQDILVDGTKYRIVGIYTSRMTVCGDDWWDERGLTIPLETYMDRIDPTHRLSNFKIKLKNKNTLQEVSAEILSRVKQAHHGIEDVSVEDLNQDQAKTRTILDDMLYKWRVVLFSLAGTVLLVGGVGILSVMLISFSNRRYEIGLRKSLGATDRQIFLQFLIEAFVLASFGAGIGTLAGIFTCHLLGPTFPYGNLPINLAGLTFAWLVTSILALLFGLYPAIKAKALSPIEAMR